MRPPPPLLALVALALASGAVPGAVRAAGIPAPAPDSAYRATSPHRRHIRVLDFGREIKWFPPPARRAAYEWYARHVDAMEVGMNSFVFSYPDTPAAVVKALNPAIETFGYDFDLTACRHAVCKSGQPVNTAEDHLPEEYYLHFSEDTRLRFIGRDGKTVMDTVGIPGVPPGWPATAASRVRVWIWDDEDWAFNVASPAWRSWYADHLLGELTRPGDPVDGLFLDAHGPGFANALAFGAHTIVLAGGGIREYGGRRPRSVHVGPYDALDRAYNADVARWLAYLRGRLAARGKFVRINTGEYFTDSLAFDQALAAGGAMTELLHSATSFRGGPEHYRRFVSWVRRLIAEGGSVDLAGTPCDEGPPDFPAGNYRSGRDRFRMWNLASYYLVKEAPGDAGRAWFDPNLCIRRESARPMSFEDEWLPAYERDLGAPRDTAAVLQAGLSRCGSYAVFARHFEHALVLVRPRDGYACTDYGDSSAVQVPLPAPMAMLEPDGSLSAPLRAVTLRNAEALILFPAPAPAPQH